MTLIFAVRNGNDIIIGADSRSVIESEKGRIVSNTSKKLIQLNEFCCILVAGDAEKGTYLIEQFKDQITKKDDVISISKKFSKFCAEEFKQLLQFMGLDSRHYPDLSFIIVGLEKKRKKEKTRRPRIFILRSRSAFFPGEEKDYAIEGVTMISDYLFAKNFKEDMEAEDIIHLIARCLHETEQIDGDVGGKPLVAGIDDQYGFKVIDISSNIEQIVNEDVSKLVND